MYALVYIVIIIKIIIINVESNFENLGQTFALNKEDVLHPSGFKTIVRFQQKDKSLIEIAKEKPNDYSIEQLNRVG